MQAKRRRVKMTIGEALKLKRPIYHDELPMSLVERATKLYPAVHTLFVSYSLEDWINGFKHDMNPDQEIAHWEQAVSKWEDRAKGKKLEPAEIKLIWHDIVMEMNEEHPIQISDKEIPFA
jgi:hypothetical protein